MIIVRLQVLYIHLFNFLQPSNKFVLFVKIRWQKKCANLYIDT